MLASSSNGNSALVATDRTRLLVDAGLSRKETFERLAAAGETPESLDAILITHEHSDHTSGLQAIARKLDIPVYLSRLTAPVWRGANTRPSLKCSRPGRRSPSATSTFRASPSRMTRPIPLDSRFTRAAFAVAIATDLGYLPDSIRFHLSRADVLLLESNHDLEMLKVGPYPWSVKQRVMGRDGHLSNEVACRFHSRSSGFIHVDLILGHLSEHNNHPAIVENCAERALGGRSLFTRLIVADPRRATESIHLLDDCTLYASRRWGAFSRDENRFAQWLEVELAVDRSAGRDRRGSARSRARAAGPRWLRRRQNPRDRARSQARRHRVHHRGGRKDGGSRVPPTRRAGCITA